ncbi:MAG: endo-1,4-beta-xylanase [Fuerstiella sp.]|nr:endo-1,4-beta-xylanase [Fuerstiella sp.]MCP4855101.1 endo-1,4-beta-xylanase [Fuerstiella sp.]
MGLIQFNVETDDLVAARGVSKSDFVTFDGRVIPADCTLEQGTLRCIRGQSDSSKLRVLCNIDGEQRVVHTTSLREAQADYALELELARGELSRLRNFYALWTGAGLKSSPALDNVISKAHRDFSSGVFSECQSNDALESIRNTHKAIGLLISAYTRQRITFRQQRTLNFPMTVGCQVSRSPIAEKAFLAAFNAVFVRTTWRDLEPKDGEYQWTELDAVVDWATDNKMFMVGGPLLDLSSDCFPAWMDPWKGDLLNLQSFTSDFVETVVSRYVGRIRHWEVVCGPNRGGANALSEEQRLNLIVRAIEAAQEVDEQIQISLRVIQPWGEYLSTTENRLPPIQFVDTLRRSGATLSEINLDLRFGDGDLESLPRDMLHVSQLLDRWSLLQLPLNVMAALPVSSDSADSNVAESAQEVNQTQLMEDLFVMSLSKERVTGFYCLNWEDEDFAGGRLFRPDGSVHAVVEKFSELEETHWPT